MPNCGRRPWLRFPGSSESPPVLRTWRGRPSRARSESRSSQSRPTTCCSSRSARCSTANRRSGRPTTRPRHAHSCDRRSRVSCCSTRADMTISRSSSRISSRPMAPASSCCSHRPMPVRTSRAWCAGLRLLRSCPFRSCPSRRRLSSKARAKNAWRAMPCSRRPRPRPRRSVMIQSLPRRRNRRASRRPKRRSRQCAPPADDATPIID
jgi:hypothetical protein